MANVRNVNRNFVLNFSFQISGFQFKKRFSINSIRNFAHFQFCFLGAWTRFDKLCVKTYFVFGLGSHKQSKWTINTFYELNTDSIRKCWEKQHQANMSTFPKTRIDFKKHSLRIYACQFYMENTDHKCNDCEWSVGKQNWM